MPIPTLIAKITPESVVDATHVTELVSGVEMFLQHGTIVDNGDGTVTKSGDVPPIGSMSFDFDWPIGKEPNFNNKEGMAIVVYDSIEPYIGEMTGMFLQGDIPMGYGRERIMVSETYGHVIKDLQAPPGAPNFRTAHITKTPAGGGCKATSFNQLQSRISFWHYDDAGYETAEIGGYGGPPPHPTEADWEAPDDWPDLRGMLTVANGTWSAFYILAFDTHPSDEEMQNAITWMAEHRTSGLYPVWTPALDTVEICLNRSKSRHTITKYLKRLWKRTTKQKRMLQSTKHIRTQQGSAQGLSRTKRMTKFITSFFTSNKER